MKNLLIFCSFFILTSCIDIIHPKPIENYKSGVIFDKHDITSNKTLRFRFIIKMKGKKQDIQTDSFYYEYVYVLKQDFDRYNVLDTIK